MGEGAMALDQPIDDVATLGVCGLQETVQISVTGMGSAQNTWLWCLRSNWRQLTRWQAGARADILTALTSAEQHVLLQSVTTILVGHVLTAVRHEHATTDEERLVYRDVKLVIDIYVLALFYLHPTGPFLWFVSDSRAIDYKDVRRGGWWRRREGFAKRPLQRGERKLHGIGFTRHSPT